MCPKNLISNPGNVPTRIIKGEEKHISKPQRFTSLTRHLLSILMRKLTELFSWTKYNEVHKWWTGRDLNPRPPPCEGGDHASLIYRPDTFFVTEVGNFKILVNSTRIFCLIFAINHRLYLPGIFWLRHNSYGTPKIPDGELSERVDVCASWSSQRRRCNHREIRKEWGETLHLPSNGT